MPARVITVRQPYATLIVLGFKRQEYRHYATKLRGRLLIHAGQGAPDAELENPRAKRKTLKAIRAAGFEDITDLPRGFIIGAVDVVRIKEYHDGGAYPFGWVLESPKMFKRAIPAKGLGQLSMWSYDEVKGKKVPS